MRRRAFLATLAFTAPAWPSSDGEGSLMTVAGPIRPDKAGVMLPHEHVMSIFGGDPTYRPRYEEKKLRETVVPYLRKLRELGCSTIADCTAAWFGRDPSLLKRISEESGVQLLTNTGYYGAAEDRYVPEFAYKQSATVLAEHWIAEWKEGIDGTAIRPGFMKIGVDSGPLSEIDRKLVRAAAITHAATGLTIAVHTGDNTVSAREQLEVLRSEGVAPAAWIWVHANKVSAPGALLEAARAGAWIEFDGVSKENTAQHLKLVQLMKDNGLLGRTLLSHDGNSFRYGGRPPKDYSSLFTHFIPALEKAGYSKAEINQLIRANPAEAFTVRKRPVT